MRLDPTAPESFSFATLMCSMLLAVVALTGCRTPADTQAAAAAGRKEVVRGTFGTYAGAPRLANGRVDVHRLANELHAIKAQTYNWLIWTGKSDWEDLKEFLPLASRLEIRVWITLVPPSESPPTSKFYSEPFRLDYEQWAVEIARLSRKHPNLVAWSLDDFSHNGKVLTPERMAGILEPARRINPRLAFVPCIYYRHAKLPFAQAYRDLIDGVLFPYRHEAGEMNLTDYDTLEAEVAAMRKLFGPSMPIFVDVYATRHSRLNDSSPEYVRQVMLLGRQVADGVLIYCHQSETASPAKHAVIKDLFHQWAR